MYKILLFPGDGIGPEVSEQVVRVLEKIQQTFHVAFEIEQDLLGGASLDHYGVPVTDSALQKTVEVDAVFLGAVGGPAWDHVDALFRPEKGLLKLREKLGVYANLRPVRMLPGLENRSPLKEAYVKDLDFLIVRELVGGIYFGKPRGIFRLPHQVEQGVNTEVYTSPEIEKVARKAFDFARRRRRNLTSVDKANVLESSQLWRKVVTQVHQEYPDIVLNHRYVDDCAMQLVRDPKQFDVIVTTNLFGDILSDEAAMLTGSIGMLPSASLGEMHGLYEPVHGSAPDIAGKDLANPLAALLSLALMCEYSLDLREIAQKIESAVLEVLREGYRTQDLYEEGMIRVGCSEMGQRVADKIN